MPENTKRSGCGCGGCLLFCFYTVIILLGGMFLSNLVDTGWDPNSAKNKLIKDSKDIAMLVKDITSEIITGEESVRPVSADTPVSTLIEAADKSYSKAMTLLKNAREVTGEERQKILRDLHTELQQSLSLYKAALAKDSANTELQKKIAHLEDLLSKMKP